MVNIETISTQGVAIAKRRDFWSDAVSRIFTPLDSQPVYPDEFDACLRSANLGSKSISEVISAPAQIGHTKFRADRLEQHVFLVHLQARGASVNRQNGREAVLKAGDFTLCDSARPYSLRFESLNDMLVLRIPAAELRARLVQPEHFTARRIAGDEGAGAIVSQTLQHLWRECIRGLDPELAKRLLTNCLDLLVTALTVATPEAVTHTASRSATLLRVRYYIEDHLTDPTLDAAHIAAAIRISPRYVHRLFEDGGEALGSYIVRRRLERCAQLLRDPARQTRSVTELAFSCAFNDASHFCRTFKRHFGQTPGEYRFASAVAAGQPRGE